MNCAIKAFRSEQITFMLFYHSSMTLRAVSLFKLTACQMANKSNSYHLTYYSIIKVNTQAKIILSTCSHLSKPTYSITISKYTESKVYFYFLLNCYVWYCM